MFDQEAFNQRDKATRELIKKIFKQESPNLIVEDNTDQYGIDLIIKNKHGLPVYYVEGESTGAWLDGEYPYDSVILYERKEHFLYGLDACPHDSHHNTAPYSCKKLPHGPLPVYFFMANKDFTRVLYYNDDVAKASPREVVDTRRGPENVRKVPTKNCAYVVLKP